MRDGKQVGYGQLPLPSFSANALLWHGSAESIVNLHSFVVAQLGPAYIGSRAFDISANGDIVGAVYTGPGWVDGVAAIWSPVPEPAAASLIALAALLGGRKKKAPGGKRLGAF